MSAPLQRGLAALRRFRAHGAVTPHPASAAAGAVSEGSANAIGTRPEFDRCDLCAAPLAETHAHLLDPGPRRVLCACGSCAPLFSGGAQTNYLRLWTRVEPLPALQLRGAEWTRLEVPVRLVFLYPSVVHERLFATYPSPAGAIEAHLSLSAWQELAHAHPSLAALAYETEALLLDARLAEPADASSADAVRAARASFDVCQRLLGVLRRPGQSPQAAWREFEHALADVFAGTAHA